ncbi:MAG: hypothetical protein LBS19_03340 [Clostridiales bacterium]|nr:hypothetical protein [Clostridiales bacterium]
MKKAICFLTALILSAAFLYAIPAAASAVETGAAMPALSDVKIEDGPGVRYMIKSYEATPDYEPDFTLLVEEPFQHEGLLYSFQYVSANEIMQTDRKWERDEVNFPVDNEDIQPVFQRLEPSIPYNGGDGYAGTLDLDHGAVWVQIMAYTNKSYTLTDTVTLAGLSSNDTSNIPKTREKSGVTMTLESVDWVVQETSTVGYDSVPTKYTATAHYSGAYSKKVPSEFLARAWYGGYVEKSSVAKVIYSVTYAAELPPSAETEPETESAPETVTEPETENSAGSAAEPELDTDIETSLELESEAISAQAAVRTESEQILQNTATEPSAWQTEEANAAADTAAVEAEDNNADDNETPADAPGKDKGWIFSVITAVIVLAAAGVVFCFNWFNVFISVGGNMEGYRRIAKRHMDSENPVLDLRGMDFGKMKRLSIDLADRLSFKLKGKEIKTLITDDYSVLTPVRKKHKDFRYVVNIPESISGGTDSEDSES